MTTKKIINIAKSKGKKHLAFLERNDFTYHGKNIESYDIIDAEYCREKSRGCFEGGNSLTEAKQKFKQYIENWNKYNTTLGKLYLQN